MVQIVSFALLVWMRLVCQLLDVILKNFPLNAFKLIDWKVSYASSHGNFRETSLSLSVVTIRRCCYAWRQYSFYKYGSMNGDHLN